ncbi:MAG TPA: membrane-bound O-acyltransferase family protein [Candidatus Omnitrophica bacterium]|nr:MAG: hypothetical protein A3B73_01140 [Omnitrophica WOR_2 bacterium RIFCSPHIGHO2_02_FULL_63_39]HAM41582.1 membrane-bound O-acyltransferase family protein [Candidatus Omnitrophota bacterium]HBH97123.1 membrane-bound O-acyltransferase family protein [Candidatus Omnitrophota bacterium]
MLFNSYVFLLVFLPATWVLFHRLWAGGNRRSALASLVAASLVYYGWWSPKYLLLILPLLGVDFLLAKALLHLRTRRPVQAKAIVLFGISVNLCALGYYKYANFFIDNVNQFLGLHLVLATIILPIGISFFTFQKMAFLVDVYQGKVAQVSLLDYTLFVLFFPQLIAGPIVHHSEVMPQFRDLKRVSARSLGLGLTILILGLAKKVLLADGAARLASPLFDAVAAGSHLDLLTSWGAALAYTAQIYFDFSGYSDMAIGLGLLFGIRLPINFHSPYQSASIMEFWRRWHITLSRFLRDYLYIPLGGNRKGGVRRYGNLAITMVLGGLWHGAGWTFVIWGALHGSYLIINHGWHALRERLRLITGQPHPAWGWLSRGITFLAVVIAWVFFRAADLRTAWDMLRAMGGGYGMAWPSSMGVPALLFTLGLLVISWVAPNTQQLTAYVGPEGAYRSVARAPMARRYRWTPSARWAISIGCTAALCLMMFSQVSEFIYFQF